MADLSHKSSIVTGSAGGIGLVIAKRMLADGSRVLLADAAKDALEQTVRALKDQYGDDAVDGYAGDLSKEENCQAMIEQAIATFSKVDILVNNAGGGVILPFLEQTPETLKQTVDRNLWTVIWSCRNALPHMISRQYGRIVNIGADSVRNGLWQHAAYNAAKGGVHGLTTGLAREFAKDGITVNTVAPCIVATDRVKTRLSEPDVPKFVQDMVGVVPMGRPAEMEEVAATVSFVASDDASFITGQVISVNGGSTML